VTGQSQLPPIVDTHAHLDDAAFDADRDEVLTAAAAVGVVAVINIGYRPESWEASVRLRERHPMVSIALGLHPGHAEAFTPELSRELRQAVREVRPVAIGEIGFDFFRSGPTFAEQERSFRDQLELASEERLPVIIHQRNAAEVLMAELDRWPNLAFLVLHSFDGDDRLLDWARERGCYFGIGGLATKPASDGLRELLRRAPQDRLLLETDSPYLPPPKAESRRNSPANLPAIAARLAPLWGLSAAELVGMTTANATTLFDLDLANSLPGSAVTANQSAGD
jgi:TatD DNase family protein